LEENMSRSAELVHVIRSGYVDLIHYGSVAVANTDGEIVYSVGDPERPAFLRSSAKPLQAIATAESGALEKFNISRRELAIMCASHAGRDIHVQTVRSILGKIGLSEEALQCSKENAIRDNCSGKHAGMLTLCRFHDFPVDNYIEPDHPAQVMIRKVIGEMCGVEDVKYGVDGCGVPTFYMPLSKMAVGFARLANPDGLPTRRKEAAIRIADAMQTHPEMTGEIRNGKTWPKQIVAKSGALAVYCGGILNQDRGIAVKIDDGNSTPCALAFTEVIRRLNLADRAELDAYQQLRPPIVTNRRGEVVGKMEVMF
jgi:L-asparaginase II